MTYEDLIDRFVYESFPVLSAAPAVRFEAVAAEVFGSKQRRQGPMPSPEAQVAVRDVLRASGDAVTFFTPWGARKQADGAPLDVLEFVALKQLACLRDGLGRYGVRARFQFRIDDHMDRWLFGDGSVGQIAEYAHRLGRLSGAVLGDAVVVVRESDVSDWGEYHQLARRLAPIFHDYLRGHAGPEAVRAVGWAGDIPAEQREYYYKANRQFYPDRDPVWELARYFAASLARVQLKAAGRPAGPHLAVNFHSPIPGSPTAGGRLYYRTLPVRYTHQHRAPWLGRGYLAVSSNTNDVGPRFLDGPLDLVPHAIDAGGVPVFSPYAVEDTFPVRVG